MDNDRLPLNVLLTKRCNADCRFCIEKTAETTNDLMDWHSFADIINELVECGLVEDILLLGGEPLYFRGIIELIQALQMSPIVTTNAHRIIADRKFMEEFRKLRIKALNISLPHYDDNKRAELMGSYLFTNYELKEVLPLLPFNVRANTLLIRDYIEDVAGIERMATLCADVGITELKVAELTGTNFAIHDFIRDEVIRFNKNNRIEIPDNQFRNICHETGGTVFWKTIFGVKVFFNSPPDVAMRGGRNKDGSFYHRVLFNDGSLGYSWRRKDGLISLAAR